jgi:glycosyltransferase involved in cell wall biosynthesis
MRTVLFVAYYYAPMQNGGVNRPVKFVKYLPHHGYRAIVVTLDDGRRVPGEEDVIRCPDRMDAIDRAGGLRGLLWRGLRAVAWRTGVWPGWRYRWQRAVLRGVADTMRAGNVDLVFATYPILENLTAGLEIARRYSVPLVADFRDGLAFEPLKTQPAFVRRKQAGIEDVVIKTAAAVTAVSDPITEHLLLRAPACKAVTVTNGFDREDYGNLSPRNLGDRINIVFTGQLFKSRSVYTVEPLLKAITTLTAGERERLALHMVGDFTEGEKALFASDAYRQFVRCHGPKPRSEALEYQVSADVLLLLAGDGIRSMVSTKLYEYFGARKPILALTRGSEAQRLIEETRTGICVNPTDVNEIAAALRTIVAQRGCYDFFRPDYPAIDARFSNQGLTARLAGIFDEVLRLRGN